jgi:predicted RNase H-like HicB family nuclease
MKFKVSLEKDEDNWFTATVPFLPGCISQGKTEKEALKNIQEAIKLHLKTMAEDGLPIKGGKNTKESFVAVAV